MNVDLIITLKTVFKLFALIDLSEHLTSSYTAIAYDFIRYIMLNELCEVDINLQNVSDENLVNIVKFVKCINKVYDRFNTFQQIYYLVWEFYLLYSYN